MESNGTNNLNNSCKTNSNESVKFEEESSENRFQNEAKKDEENQLHQNSLEMPIGKSMTYRNIL